MSDAQMLAAVVVGAVLPMAAFFVREYTRNQTKHEECEKRLEARAEAYHALAERFLVALEKRKPPEEPKP